MVRTPARIHCAIAALGAASMLAVPAMAVTLEGTDGPDLLRGTDRADDIRARAGNDVVIAGAGNDLVSTGPGHDVVRLGPGVDTSRNAAGGRAGNDVVYGGPGRDLVINAYVAALGRGNDRYLADGGRSGRCLTVDMGPGNDKAPGDYEGFYGGQYDCVLNGGPGDDLIAWTGYDGPGGPALTTMRGGRGADVLWGGYNEDVLVGGPGPDRIHAAEDYWPHSDVIVAGPGDDEIWTDWADESEPGTPIDCGAGVDTVHGAATSRVLVDCEVVDP